jgi:hypothetical protein
MTPGFVYILLNPSHKNMIKIGKTTRSPQERADSLSNHSGVPTKFFVAYWVKVNDMDAAESKMHHELKNMRVNKNREFFNLESKKAIDLLIKISNDYPFNEEVQTPRPVMRCLCGKEITRNHEWCPKCGRDNENYVEEKLPFK